MSDLREELLAIRATHGQLTPQLVVDAARPPDSALHSRFEWNDGLAGEAFRRQQASELIRKVRVVYAPANEGAYKSVRAFHAVRTLDGGSAYMPVEEIVDNPLLNELLRREMERDWRALRQRWEDYTEFWQLVKEASEAI
jgi:hypothetical protein